MEMKIAKGMEIERKKSGKRARETEKMGNAK
jgi:hypothetical protein